MELGPKSVSPGWMNNLERVIDTMCRFLCRWLTPLVIAGICCLSPVQAQKAGGGSSGIDRGYQALPSEGGDTSHNPAFAYFLAACMATVILVIVCTPSRKLPP